MAQLLIIDDDPNTLASLARAFKLAGHEAATCDNALTALDLVRKQRFDLIFSDVVMPGKDGIALLEDLKKAGVETPVVMISGQATVDAAVRATRLGAVDFLEKPLSTDKLLLTVDNITKLAQLEEENRELRRRVGKHEIVYAGAVMQRVMAQVDRVAASESRVCILGETGTGKELIARTLHQKSSRAKGPFVTLNCAAVPSELIESELFGHEKGAFTGAAGRHTGKFEQAHRGTLFLDEIGDMPPMMQTKLLRVLEEGEVQRVGGDRTLLVDVRCVFATHRDLEDLVAKGEFRADLYHRIYVFPLRLPPLRERLDDIPVLVEQFSRQVAEQNGWRRRAFDPGALAELRRYSWPGNVRELRNVVERLMLLCEDQVDLESVRLALPRIASSGPAEEDTATGPLADRVERFERAAVLAELERHRFQMAATARALGLERSHLYRKCQQLGIDLRAVKGVTE